MEGNINLNRWMSNLPESLHSRPLNQISIPGSHNSFTYDIIPEAAVCESATPQELKLLTQIPFLKNIIHGWSVTQNLSVLEQLEMGVRYFDIRLAAQMINGLKQVVSVHSLYGSSYSLYLDQISDFLKINPKEILILDFNHFYDIDDNLHLSIIDNLLRRFENMICPYSDITEINLNFLWKNSYKIIIVYQYNCEPPNRMLWPEHSIRSGWPNVDTAQALISYLNNEVENTKNMKHKFVVYQGVLTPTANLITQNLFGKLKDKVAIPVAKEMLLWMKNFSSSHRSNIFMLDFVEIENFTLAVIFLNFS